MNNQFIFEEKQKRNLFMGVAIGAVLLIVGLLLSNVSLGGDHGGHGGDAEEHAVSQVIDNDKLLADASGPEEGEEGATEEAEAAHEEGGHGGGHGKPEPSFMKKLGSVTLIGNWYWILAAVFGVFFMSVKYLANAGWYVTIKRILETYYMWIPVSIVLMLGFFFAFKGELYMWASDTLAGVPDVAKEEVEHLIHHKSPFLNVAFYLIMVVGVLGFYFFGGHTYRKNSLSEEREGGSKWFDKGVVFSCIFLPVFALTFCTIAFQWIMSLDVTWFSTIFGVYNFAGMFVLGATITTLIIINLKEKGYLEQVTGDHIHDLAKFMFAFSIFWAYIWISQYLLIWYANIPEETVYYTDRYENYQLLFWLNFAINFLFPFLALMTRGSKRQMASLKKIATIMLFGRFLDIFLMVMPGVVGEHWDLGLMIAAAGMVVLQGGIFLYLAYNTLTKAPLIATKHPYYEESIHHDTGV